MPNIDELLNQGSAELSKNDSDPIWIELAPKTWQLGNHGRENQRLLPIPEGILQPGRHTHKTPREKYIVHSDMKHF